MTKKHRLATVLGTSTLLVALAGVAFAAIPGAGGLISGCYGKQSGVLRVIDSEAGGECLASEEAIAWNERGPQGAQGLQGPAGPAGPAGPQGQAGPRGEPGNLALAGQTCPEGEFVTGFDASGGLVCSTLEGDGDAGGDGGGDGGSPVLGVFPSPLHFGNVRVGTAATLGLTVTNTGTAAAQIEAVAVGPGGFSIAGTTCGTLAPGASCTVGVRFQPLAVQIYSGTVVVNAIPVPVAGVGVS